MWRVSTGNARPSDVMDGGIVQQPGDGVTIQGRRHDQQAQVVAQDRLRLKAQG